MGPRLCGINIPKCLIFCGSLQLVVNYSFNKSVCNIYSSYIVTIRLWLRGRARILQLLHVMICRYRDAQNDWS